MLSKLRKVFRKRENVIVGQHGENIKDQEETNEKV